MQVVGGAHAAPQPSVAGDPSVLARAGAAPHPCPLPKSKRKKKKKRKGPRIGLSAYEEMRLRERLRGNDGEGGRLPAEDPRTGQPIVYACSEPWVDAQIKSFEDVDEDNEPIVYRFHDPRVFPPGLATTSMKRCVGCGRKTPPQNVGSSGHCDDCRFGGMSELQLSRLGKSHGVIDFARLKASRRRGESYPS